MAITYGEDKRGSGAFDALDRGDGVKTAGKQVSSFLERAHLAALAVELLAGARSFVPADGGVSRVREPELAAQARKGTVLCCVASAGVAKQLSEMIGTLVSVPIHYVDGVVGDMPADGLCFSGAADVVRRLMEKAAAGVTGTVVDLYLSESAGADTYTAMLRDMGAQLPGVRQVYVSQSVRHDAVKAFDEEVLHVTSATMALGDGKTPGMLLLDNDGDAPRLIRGVTPDAGWHKGLGQDEIVPCVVGKECNYDPNETRAFMLGLGGGMLHTAADSKTVDHSLVSDLAGYSYDSDGETYLELLHPNCRQTVIEDRGTVMEWKDFLDLFDGWFLPEDELRGIGVWDVGSYRIRFGVHAPPIGRPRYVGNVVSVFKRHCARIGASYPSWLEFPRDMLGWGYCYARGFRVSFGSEVMHTLKMEPSVAMVLGKLTDQNVDWSNARNTQVVLSGFSRGARVFHVTDEGGVGISLADVMVHYHLAGRARRLTRVPKDLIDRVRGLGPVDYPALLDQLGSPLMAQFLAEYGVSVNPRDQTVVSSSPALLSVDQKQRHRMLEAVGDGILTTLLAVRTANVNSTVEHYQNARSAVTSNGWLAKVFTEKVPDGAVSFAGGVDSGGKVGARALEVLVGAVYLCEGMDKARVFVDRLAIFEHPAVEAGTR